MSEQVSSTPKIKVDNITMAYGDTQVLERLSLDVETGSFCTIVGASGCGKSTFLRLLLSQERPTSGKMELDGTPLPPEPTPDRGIVFQKYSVFPHLTVKDNLILADELAQAPKLGKLFGAKRKQAYAKIDEILEQIGLAAAKDRYPSQLSGGMQQRLAIAQALLKEPKILLLDEPFGALDPGIRLDMHALILDLWRSRNMTIFMVTHDIHEAFKLGTRLLVFDKIRHDPHDPSAYGATITYDMALDPQEKATPSAPDALLSDIMSQKTKEGTS